MECIVVSQKSNETLLKLSGECSIYSAAELKDQLNFQYEAVNRLLIDLSEVDEIDTSCFQLLVALKKDALKHQKRVSFINHSIPVLKYIDLYGCAALFGDRIVVKKQDRELFDFSYGLVISKQESIHES